MQIAVQAISCYSVNYWFHPVFCFGATFRAILFPSLSELGSAVRSESHPVWLLSSCWKDSKKSPLYESYVRKGLVAAISGDLPLSGMTIAEGRVPRGWVINVEFTSGLLNWFVNADSIPSYIISLLSITRTLSFPHFLFQRKRLPVQLHKLLMKKCTSALYYHYCHFLFIILWSLLSVGCH